MLTSAAHMFYVCANWVEISASILEASIMHLVVNKANTVFQLFCLLCLRAVSVGDTKSIVSFSLCNIHGVVKVFLILEPTISRIITLNEWKTFQADMKLYELLLETILIYSHNL